MNSDKIFHPRLGLEMYLLVRCDDVFSLFLFSFYL